MSDNNTMYRMYRQMIQGYKLGNDGTGLFEHAVHCWLALNPENPFQESTDAYEHFFRMKNYYNVWQLHSADQKISQKRMLNAARDLCATKTKNPYKFDKQAEDAEKALLKENMLKEHEETLKATQEAERQKAEQDEEVRQIMEEIKQDNIENEKRLNEIKGIASEVNEIAKKQTTDKKAQQHYVFNVVEDPPKKKISWFKRIIKH